MAIQELECQIQVVGEESLQLEAHVMQYTMLVEPKLTMLFVEGGAWQVAVEQVASVQTVLVGCGAQQVAMLVEVHQFVLEQEQDGDWPRWSSLALCMLSYEGARCLPFMAGVMGTRHISRCARAVLMELFAHRGRHCVCEAPYIRRRHSASCLQHHQKT